ncbi:hypothetical protein BC941DRAFT_472862 [Chlamydoabsidia padenii]|nr:hypothetical protein BC941DRAFT_472862 [Chlamydoabsidia padenii]
MSQIERLPNEILGTILDNFSSPEHLLQVVLVNKHMYSMAVNQLWRSPMPKNYNTQHIADAAVTILMILRQNTTQPLRPYPLGQHIRRLEFKYGDQVNNIVSILNYAHLVEMLILRSLTITDVGFKHIAQRCPHLKSCHLWNIKRITNMSLMALGQYCLNLRCLRLVRNGLVSNRGMRQLMKDCTRLSRVIIISCPLLYRPRRRHHKCLQLDSHNLALVRLEPISALELNWSTLLSVV